MISFIRNSLYTRYFWAFMALYLFNLSADAPDVYSESVPVEITYNEQESFVEIVVEKVLGFEDVIAEYNDNDETQESVLKKNASLSLFVVNESRVNSNKQLTNYSKIRYSQYQYLLSSLCIEIQSPPPEV